MRGMQVHRVFLQVPRVPNMDRGHAVPPSQLLGPQAHTEPHTAKGTSKGSVSWLVLGVSIFYDVLGGGGQPRSWQDTPFPSLTQYNEAQVMTCL